jgi:NodT family efflux transporter outer membrane factor (OMF) lipoprotein
MEDAMGASTPTSRANRPARRAEVSTPVRCDQRSPASGHRFHARAGAAAAILAALTCGCTPFRDYVHNGFKVGPNYVTPPAAVAPQWIDANDVNLRPDYDDLARWWTVFNDPALDALICTARRQNLTLRQAGYRILQARSQLDIDIGNLFPQSQQTIDTYVRSANSRETVNGAFGMQPRFTNQWNLGFSLNWELDFWGRFRRAIESDSAVLDASVENYDAALVTLLGDVASNYAQMRTLEQRITYAQHNVQIQRNTLAIVEARFKAETISELDVDQAQTTLAATEAGIAELQIALRQTVVQLCTLMGMPPEELFNRIGPGAIPIAPKEVAVGIPADLLRRRPDVRAAERQVAAQCAAIGVAQSQLYPHLAINGTLGWASRDVNHLFESRALNSNVTPTLQWDLLNYGRLVNGVRLQDALFQELVANYRNTVLLANQDVENGLVTFLRGRERADLQQRAVDSAVKAVDIALKQYQAGTTDFTTVTQVQQIQVQQQDLLAQAQGEIAVGLIQVYRALGGGWQLRCQGCSDVLPPGAATTSSRPAPETIPAPPPTDQPILSPLPQPGEFPQQPISLRSTTDSASTIQSNAE